MGARGRGGAARRLSSAARRVAPSSAVSAPRSEWPDAAEGDARALAAAGRVERDQRGHAHEGEVARAARHLHEGAARAPRLVGDPHFDEQLAGPERRGEWPHEEPVRGHGAPGLLTGEGELRLECHHDGGELGGGIGVGEAAADGAAVANGQVTHEAARLGEDGRARPHRLRPLHRMLAGGRADGEAVGGGADIREFADAVDVDQGLGMRGPEVEKRDQALAAGEDLGSVTLPRQQSERLVDGARGVIHEPRRLHGFLLTVAKRRTRLA